MKARIYQGHNIVINKEQLPYSVCKHENVTLLLTVAFMLQCFVRLRRLSSVTYVLWLNGAS